MYYTGMDPFTKQEVYVARHLHDRKLQRVLLQFFKPENYFEVRKALEQAGRTDLIGGGCDAPHSGAAAQGGAGSATTAGEPGGARRERAYGAEPWPTGDATPGLPAGAESDAAAGPEVGYNGAGSPEFARRSHDREQ
jgi:hypothetical protein